MKHLRNWIPTMKQSKRFVAYLVMATILFTLGYFAGGAKNNVATEMTMQNASMSGIPWQNAKLTEAKKRIALEKDCIDTIKMLPGIADAIVISHKYPVWECNVWARKNKFSVHVTIESMDNKPLPDETIDAIGRIAAVFFGIIDLKDIRIFDARNNQVYDGSGKFAPLPTATSECSCICSL